jgi:uncharacterized protein YegL
MTVWHDEIIRPLVIVHELGHFIYGLRNENTVGGGGPNGSCLGRDPNTDAPKSNGCIMEALQDDGGHFTAQGWDPLFTRYISEFCSTATHTLNNEQQSVNGQSCWGTMAVHYPDLLPIPPTSQELAPPGADQIDWVVLDNTQRFVLVIDHSFSMNGYKLEEAKFGADWWADAIPLNDSLAVVSFSDTVTIDYPMHAIVGLTDRQNIHNAIAPIAAMGATAIGDALRTALNLIIPGPSAVTKVIVLLTDGQDNSSHEPVDGVLLQDLSNAGVKVFTIGIGADVNSALLLNIANRTGGTYYVS